MCSKHDSESRMTHAWEENKAQFDWSTLDDLKLRYRQLERVGWAKRPTTSNHCDVLDCLALTLSASRTAVDNAKKLASGHPDLAVILLEPADREDLDSHQTSLPPTIELVDRELRTVSRTRNWKNTYILDIRPFRSDKIRATEKQCKGIERCH